MAIAASLWFDPALEAAVRALWAEVSRRGIPSLHDGPYRPHVTLGVWESLAPDRLAIALRELATVTAPIALAFDEPGAFEQTEGVAFLRPRPCEPLVTLQARVDALGVRAGGVTGAYQHPEAWNPHCTIAWGLSPAALADMLDYLRGTPLPLAGHGMAIGIIETPAEIELERIELRG